jgi:hypothetical protein
MRSLYTCTMELIEDIASHERPPKTRHGDIMFLEMNTVTPACRVSIYGEQKQHCNR